MLDEKKKSKMEQLPGSPLIHATHHTNTQTITLQRSKKKNGPSLQKWQWQRTAFHTLSHHPRQTHTFTSFSVYAAQSSVSDREVVDFAQALSSSSLCKMKCADLSFYSCLIAQESILIPNTTWAQPPQSSTPTSCYSIVTTEGLLSINMLGFLSVVSKWSEISIIIVCIV